MIIMDDMRSLGSSVMLARNEASGAMYFCSVIVSFFATLQDDKMLIRQGPELFILP